MYERLMLCESAVADVTGANPNVYYELGIRHAMRPRSDHHSLRRRNRTCRSISRCCAAFAYQTWMASGKLDQS